VIWIGLAYLFNRWSAEQDRTADPRLASRMYTFSAIGLILYTLTATFAAYDWMMSLEPEWFSSIYGVIFMAGQALFTIAFVIILARLLEKREPLSQWLSIPVFNDLGNFLMAFIAFWAYVSFSQYLIIYQSNLPETVTWYITRSQGGWQWIALILIFFHFALPFVVLLARRIKRNERVLTAVAIYMVFMHGVDLFWLVMPAFHRTGLYIHWLDFVIPIGIGGFWVAFFIWQLQRKPLVPLNDPYFQEVPVHHHG
jgi:Ni/Fe-hydrogenase subunit HybB-like protein